MKSTLILFSLSLLVSSCVHTHNNNKTEKIIPNQYSVFVNYTSHNDSLNSWDDKRFPKDSLYLTCEFYGNTDSQTREKKDSLNLSVYKDGVFLLQRNYSGDFLALEGHDLINFGKISNIHSIGFRMNHGNMCYAEVDSSRHIIRAIYEAAEKKVLIEFLRYVPMYR